MDRGEGWWEIIPGGIVQGCQLPRVGEVCVAYCLVRGEQVVTCDNGRKGIT
jgi:hypothetical protein